MTETKTSFDIPKEVSCVTQTLKKAGFEAYLVGGCVRDLAMGKSPKDWDATTNAKPEEIQGLFEKTFYENDYGTVGVVNEGAEPTLEVIEVTPYRLEARYSDKRRPDEVKFAGNLEDDLKRRDFTINALAYNPSENTLVDLHGGQKDIKDKMIRAVGKPDDRFSEDALRIMRAIRLSAELGFEIEKNTAAAIKNTAQHLGEMAKERIRDEFSRIIMSPEPARGLTLAKDLGLLPYIVPELEKAIGVGQNQAHAYDVWEHTIKTVQASADKGFPLEVRLAALFHDIAKPHTKAMDEKKNDWSFHGHEVVGAKIAKKTLSELRFTRNMTDKTSKLVRWHMFFSDPEKITLSAVRRLVRNVGPDNVQDLMNLRICDRIGTGRPKEQPYRLRKYQSMIEEALRAPVSVGMLKIDGEKVMKVTGETPGPRIGYILHALLDEVLDDPEKNTAEYMEKRAKELSEKQDGELKKLGDKGKGTKEHKEEKEIEKIRKKYWVK